VGSVGIQSIEESVIERETKLGALRETFSFYVIVTEIHNVSV
jgi:hypothetical protein